MNFAVDAIVTTSPSAIIGLVVAIAVLIFLVLKTKVHALLALVIAASIAGLAAAPAFAQAPTEVSFYYPVAVGGPIALAKEGDRIRIDIPAYSLELLVSDEELAERRKEWKPRTPKITEGYLARYAALVTSGNKGAVLRVPGEENE